MKGRRIRYVAIGSNAIIRQTLRMCCVAMLFCLHEIAVKFRVKKVLNLEHG